MQKVKALGQVAVNLASPILGPPAPPQKAYIPPAEGKAGGGLTHCGFPARAYPSVTYHPKPTKPPGLSLEAEGTSILLKQSPAGSCYLPGN